MKLSRRAIIVASCLLSLMTFAFVQDRVTAAGARRYVAVQRASTPESGSVTIEDVMAPAIRSSVRWGALSAGLVLAGGLVLARFTGH